MHALVSHLMSDPCYIDSEKHFCIKNSVNLNFLLKGSCYQIGVLAEHISNESHRTTDFYT